MDARTRLGWIRLYEEVGDAGIVCRRCGISRPTLRKWWRRYHEQGAAGLEARSRRPRCSPAQKVFAHEEALILTLRRERKLGVKRLRNELIREHGLELAVDTIHKVLVRHGEGRPKRRLLRRKGTKRYSRPIPGDRVQVDVCKIGPGVYQYTAIDDCSRFQLVGIYPQRTAGNTLHFPERVLEEMPSRSSASRPTAARSSSPTRSRTSSAPGGSSFAPSGRAPRTSTALGRLLPTVPAGMDRPPCGRWLSGRSAPRSRSSGRPATLRPQRCRTRSTSGSTSTTGSARTAPSVAAPRSTASAS